MKLSKEVRDSLTKEQFRYYKQHGVLPKDPVSVVVPQVTTQSNEKVVVLCVRFGNKYGRDYVERLRNMVARHMTIPYEFVCLTDDPNPIEGVRTIRQNPAGYQKLWWHKVHMFDPNLDVRGRILYLDLDVIICGNLNKLVTNLKDEFLGIRDFNRKFHATWTMLNSSVMTWLHGTQSDIWEKFMANPASAMRLHGDQDWIWACARTRLKFFPIPVIQSYKWEIRNRDELVQRTGRSGFRFVATDLKVDPELSIAVFHGDPKPENVPDPFVVDNWQ
jgi:hypothetical protein